MKLKSLCKWQARWLRNMTTPMWRTHCKVQKPYFMFFCAWGLPHDCRLCWWIAEVKASRPKWQAGLEMPGWEGKGATWEICRGQGNTQCRACQSFHILLYFYTFPSCLISMSHLLLHTPPAIPYFCCLEDDIAMLYFSILWMLKYNKT